MLVETTDRLVTTREEGLKDLRSNQLPPRHVTPGVDLADDAVTAFAFGPVQQVVRNLDERRHVDVLAFDAGDTDRHGDGERVAFVLDRLVRAQAPDLFAERARAGDVGLRQHRREFFTAVARAQLLAAVLPE